jgi:hypothetical protein
MVASPSWLYLRNEMKEKEVSGSLLDGFVAHWMQEGALRLVLGDLVFLSPQGRGLR